MQYINIHVHSVQTQLKGEVIEIRHELQGASIEVENLKQKLANKEQELEELQCQITTYINTIEVQTLSKIQEMYKCYIKKKLRLTFHIWYGIHNP